MSIEVIGPGLLTTIQDLGRYRFQQYGISVCGAMDTVALRIANMLVGNDEGEATLEMTLTGPSLLFNDDASITICGADLSPTIDQVDVPGWRPVFVRRGSVLRFGRARQGCRAYLAIAGGFDVAEVMGSRSTYLLTGIGGYRGRPLQRDDLLGYRERSTRWKIARQTTVDRGPFITTLWSAAPEILPSYRRSPALRAIPGIEFEKFTAESRKEFFAEAFQVMPQSDRMGYRLSGPMLRLSEPLEMISEGVSIGTVQVPPDGNPIVLLADRQTVGGYPRIAQVASVDLPTIAQTRAGEAMRFEPITLETAQRLYLERETALRRLKRAIELKSQQLVVGG